MFARRNVAFPELTYANADQPPFKRWLIRRVEKASGRDKFAVAYANWREYYWPTSASPMSDMLDLAGIKLAVDGAAWPPELLPKEPVVIIANHPFGIGDGIAVLSMAEKLGQPLKILINNELLKVSEIRGYALPVSFEETKEAMRMNMKTKKDAEAFLRSGGVVVIFPSGGVATAEKGFGKATELPWKLFPAKLIQATGATVLPIFFDGQNGRSFHLASRFSMTLRTSLLIREFRKLSGRTINATVGAPISPDQWRHIDDRHKLVQFLQSELMKMRPEKTRARRPRKTLT
jgi:putative hemolysin